MDRGLAWPPDSAMIAAMTMAVASRSQRWSWRGITPSGMRRKSSTRGPAGGTALGGGGVVCSTIVFLLPRAGDTRPREHEPLFAEGEVPLVEHLRHHVGPVVHLEVHKIGGAILDLVERRQLGRVRLDGRHMVVVKHPAHEARRPVER